MTVEVVVYRRDGCHLCDEAERELDQIARERGGFTIRTVDIEGDERLHLAYLERIPVIEAGGTIVCELWLDRAALLDRLDTLSAEHG